MLIIFDDWKSWVHTITGALAYFFHYCSSSSRCMNSLSGRSRRIESLETLLSSSLVAEVLEYAAV